MQSKAHIRDVKRDLICVAMATLLLIGMARAPGCSEKAAPPEDQSEPPVVNTNRLADQKHEGVPVARSAPEGSSTGGAHHVTGSEYVDSELEKVLREVDTGRQLTDRQQADIRALVEGLVAEDREVTSGPVLGRVEKMGQAPLPYLINGVRSEPDFRRRQSALCAIFLVAEHARKTKPEGSQWVDGLRPLWLAMCRDPHPAIRAFSARKLKSLHRSTAVADLARVLKEEPDPGVRRYIAGMLMSMGHRELVPPEVAKAVDDSGWTQ